MTYYTIYETTNKVTNEIYIGQHVTENLSDGYLGSGVRLAKSIKKYGRENFDKKLLHIYDNFEEMDQKEAELVDENFILKENTLNLIPGGSKGNYKTVVVESKIAPGIFFRIPSEEYDRELYSAPSSGSLVVSLITEPTKFFRISAFEYDRTKHITSTTGTLRAIRKSDGISVRISVDEYHLNKNLYTTSNTGKLSVENLVIGGYEQISIEDYDSGRHRKVFGGIVVNDNGVNRYASLAEFSDQSSCLNHVHKGKVTVEVKRTGEIKHVTLDEFSKNRRLYKTMMEGKTNVRHRITGKRKTVSIIEITDEFKKEWIVGCEGTTAVFDIRENKFIRISVNDVIPEIHKHPRSKNFKCYRPDETEWFEFWGTKSDFLEEYKAGVSVWNAMIEGRVYKSYRGASSHFHGCTFEIIDWKNKCVVNDEL